MVVKVGGIECRALLDSGESSCYASAKLLDLLGMHPTEIKPKKIEMLMASVTARTEIFKTTVSFKSGDYSLDVSLTKVNRGELLSLENPRYEQLIKTYSHLRGVEMDDTDARPLLPIHVIQGTGVYARIKTDASAKAHPNAVLLNDCLYPGPTLQNKMWNVLVRSCVHPIAVVGDLKEAFLQVRSREADRDALRFHWKQGEHSEIETLRFTRALFGLAPSPFLLSGVMEHHLDTWEAHEPHVVAELRKSLYVDDLISGGTTVEQAKEQAFEIIEDATFTLHKWQSSEPKLEGDPILPVDKEGTFAKQQLGELCAGGSSLLGLGRSKGCDEMIHKGCDEMIVSFPEWKSDPTKRSILCKLASIYDPLGFISPVTLGGKCLYHSVCLSRHTAAAC